MFGLCFLLLCCLSPFSSVFPPCFLEVLTAYLPSTPVFYLIVKPALLPEFFPQSASPQHLRCIFLISLPLPPVFSSFSSLSAPLLVRLFSSHPHITPVILCLFGPHVLRFVLLFCSAVRIPLFARLLLPFRLHIFFLD